MAEAPAYRFIRAENAGPVAVITLNRPEARNPLSARMLIELMAAIEAANEDDAIGAIVLASAGPVFCAGADFKDVKNDPLLDERGRPMTSATIGMRQDTSWLHLLQRSKPNVVAVQGPAIGLGVTHILGADIRVCAEEATFAFPFLRLGTLPEFGATALLPRLVGFGRAMDLCLGARTIDAVEAYRIGLVTRVIPGEQLREEAIAMATEIGGYKPKRLAKTKDLLYANWDEGDTNALLRRESMAFVEMFKEGQGTGLPGRGT